jgi:hypothetical protein
MNQDPLTSNAFRRQTSVRPFQSRESTTRVEYDQRYRRSTKNLCIAYSFVVIIMSVVMLIGWIDQYNTDIRLILYMLIMIGCLYLATFATLILVNQEWSWTRIELVQERRGVDVEDIEPFSLDDYGQHVKDTVLDAYEKNEYELYPDAERLVNKYDVRYTGSTEEEDEIFHGS